MTTYHANINSSTYRLDQPRPVTTREQEMARIERYLAEMAAFNWTETYKTAQARLAQLKAGE